MTFWHKPACLCTLWRARQNKVMDRILPADLEFCFLSMQRSSKDWPHKLSHIRHALKRSVHLLMKVTAFNTIRIIWFTIKASKVRHICWATLMIFRYAKETFAAVQVDVHEVRKKTFLSFNVGNLVSKPCMQGGIILQQPPLPITIPPYIRPVISWVLTVRAHAVSALTLLHQPTDGEQWWDGDRERGKPWSTFHCQNGTVRPCGMRVRVGGRGGVGWCKQDLVHTKALEQFWKLVT